MHSPWLILLTAGLVLGACNEDEGRPGPTPEARESVIQAAERTLAAGPARIQSTVRSRDVRYRLDGRLDAAVGYRLCAAIVASPSAYLRGGSLWLEGRAGAYETLTTGSPRCAPSAVWVDDHPPTLELEGDLGGEDFLHAALVALTALKDGAVIAAQARTCGDSQCYRVDIDFKGLDRKPRERDEDGWTLRPLLRSLGRHPVAVRVDPAGYVNRLVLDAPVRVDFDLSAFGEERPVPLVHADAIE